MEKLEHLCQKMVNSAHRPSYIRRVLITGITKFNAKVQNSKRKRDHPSFKPLYLGTHYDSVGRWKKKTMAKESWYLDRNSKETDYDTSRACGSKRRNKKPFHKAGNQVKTSTVMFVPPTRGGILARRMRENEEKLSQITKFRVKIQETGGTRLASLFSTELAKGEHCGREKCQPCGSKSEGRTNCKTQSILYESKCEVCKKENDTKD